MRNAKTTVSPLETDFGVEEQKCLIGCTRGNEPLELRFPKLKTVSESVEPSSRNCDPNMTQNLHVYAICCQPEVDNDVISGVAASIKFGDSRSNGFRDIR